MAFSTINKSSSYLNSILYTGNGSTQSITGVGFQPDLTWIKARDAAENHRLFDAVRGVTKYIASNNGNVEATDATTLTAFGADGFTLSTAHPVNKDTEAYVSWNWKANGAGSSNTDGSITSTVSVNTTSGFSIVKYTGTGAAATIGHGLGAVPKAVIIKKLSQSDNWFSYHEPLGNLGRLQLSATAAVANNSGYWDSTSPTSTVFTVLANGANNASGETHVAYCFADVAGYSKMGSYSGNGNADGPFVYTGFKPSLIIVKRTDSTGNWAIEDNKRVGYNPSNNHLYPNLANAESTGYTIDQLSNGFKVRVTSADINASGGSYICMAFGQPIISNGGVCATAR
jgi:hypothetical protein